MQSVVKAKYTRNISVAYLDTKYRQNDHTLLGLMLAHSVGFALAQRKHIFKGRHIVPTKGIGGNQLGCGRLATNSPI